MKISKTLKVRLMVGSSILPFLFISSAGAVLDDLTSLVEEQVEEQVTEQIEEQVTELVQNQVVENIVENVTENVVENVTENITENVVESITENVTENVVENVAANVTGQVENLVSQSLEENALSQNLDGVLTQTTEHLSQTLSLIPNTIGHLTEVADYLAGDVIGQTLDIVSQTLREVLLITETLDIKTDKLMEKHADIIELDPNGLAILRGEIIAVSMSPSAQDSARVMGYRVMSHQVLSGVNLSLTRLRAPRSMSAAEALDWLRQRDPNTQYDFNHLYFESSSQGTRIAYPHSPQNRTPLNGTGAKVGLIDGGIDTDHSALNHVAIRAAAFSGAPYAKTDHGTAAAFLMAGEAAGRDAPAPGARIYSADVFGGVPYGGSAVAVANAFAWLASEDVTVINASLVGPHNLALEAVVKALVAQDRVIIAAVGNEGPSAPPLFPAAYDGVLGVTAVDGKDRVLIEAARGNHVDVAAPGADMIAAGAQKDYVGVRGTSFAAPIISGFIAEHINLYKDGRLAQAERTLTASAEDRGPGGRDPHYGIGLVGAGYRLRLPATTVASINSAQ